VQKRLLLTRSRHDLYNQYLYPYCEEVLAAAERQNWKRDRAEDGNNTRQTVHSRLEGNDYDFVFFNGHGTEDGAAILGNYDEVVMDGGSSGLLKGTIVYARSCFVRKALAKNAIASGCAAFIGHSGLFIIPHMDRFESTPIRNPVAKRVLEVSNLIALHILKGDTVENSVQVSMDRASELMLKTLVSREPEDIAVFRALYTNFATLGYEGDGKASAGD